MNHPSNLITGTRISWIGAFLLGVIVATAVTTHALWVGPTGNPPTIDVTATPMNPWALSGSNLYFSTGNVGVGAATAPKADIEVFNNSLYSVSESANNGFQISTGHTNNTDQTLYMGADGTNFVSYIQSVKWGCCTNTLALNARGGNVGIGTVTPRAQLDATNGGVFNHVAVGAAPFGALPYPYESIQLPAAENFRLNFGTTQRAAIWNDGGVWLASGNFTSDASGNVTARNFNVSGDWFRVNGGQGIYWNDYGGGWNMTDTTWLRAYGGKWIYTPGNIRADNALETNNLCDTNGGYCTSPFIINYIAVRYSDARMKKDVTALPNGDGLDAIMRLRPVAFDWRDVDRAKKEGPQMGFIAQEVDKVFPGLTYAASPKVDIHNADGSTTTIENVQGLDYAKLVVPLVSSVQELKKENDDLTKRLDALEKEFEAYKAAHS